MFAIDSQMQHNSNKLVNIIIARKITMWMKITTTTVIIKKISIKTRIININKMELNSFVYPAPKTNYDITFFTESDDPETRNMLYFI